MEYRDIGSFLNSIQKYLSRVIFFSKRDARARTHLFLHFCRLSCISYSYCLLYMQSEEVQDNKSIVGEKSLRYTAMLNATLLRSFQISYQFSPSHASLHIFICTNGLAYLTELVPDFYLYLFLLLFAVFVRCTVAVCWLVLSVKYSISESLKLVLLEIETHISEGEMKKYGCLWVGSSVQSPVSCPTGVKIHFAI